MKFDEVTLARRKPLWLALSDLFLETELQDHDHKYIAKIMKASEYSLQEIEQILMLELFPVLLPNLPSVAGEWTGFDEKWLYGKIINAKKPGFIKRWYWRRNRWLIEDNWQKITALYQLDETSKEG